MYAILDLAFAHAYCPIANCLLPIINSTTLYANSSN
jgi:hypothetical protein